VSNIDSKTESDTHDRFKRRRVHCCLASPKFRVFQQPAKPDEYRNKDPTARTATCGKLDGAARFVITPVTMEPWAATPVMAITKGRFGCTPSRPRLREPAGNDGVKQPPMGLMHPSPRAWKTMSHRLQPGDFRVRDIFRTHH
jgi:hypothetical protein